MKQNKIGTTVISKYDYAVNAIGQRTGVATSGSAYPALPSWLWTYDDLGQVTKADSNVNTSDRRYVYDTIGNRSLSVDGLAVPIGPNYESNALNQYTRADNTQSVAIRPTYDFDGNATAYPLAAAPAANSILTYDAENRVTQCTVNGVYTGYAYDAQSRRISKIEGLGPIARVTVYLYDAWNCIAEYALEFKGGDAPYARLTKTRLWGTDLSGTPQGAGGVGGLLSETGASTGPFFPTYDGNGNISEYLTTTGTIAAHFEYDPFGNTVVNTDTSNLFTYRFSTKPRDKETGLYYYGYRYYDPMSGRWPSRDPIEELGGKNLYGLAGNDGVRYVDLLGLVEFDFQPIYDQMIEGGQDAAARTREDLANRQKEEYDDFSKEQKVTRTRPNQGVEYAGRVCRKCVNGIVTYYRTTKENLKRGGNSSSYPHLAPPCDAGDTTVSTFHSHPDEPGGNPVPYLSGDGERNGPGDLGGDRDYAKTGGGLGDKRVPPNRPVGATTQDGKHTQIFNRRIQSVSEYLAEDSFRLVSRLV